MLNFSGRKFDKLYKNRQTTRKNTLYHVAINTISHCD